jgi:hypothetical protein
LLIVLTFFILNAYITVRESEESRPKLINEEADQSLQGQKAMMTERTDETKKPDYSCEIISFIVIVVLSELSHFWYIAIAFCFAALCWGVIVMLGKLAIFAASKVSWRLRVSHATSRKAGDIGSQVFQPSKIRQSLDC